MYDNKKLALLIEELVLNILYFTYLFVTKCYSGESEPKYIQCKMTIVHSMIKEQCNIFSILKCKIRVFLP